MYLSKSHYCQLWQCPRRLWLEIHAPQCRAQDPDDSRLQTGLELGRLARGLFGPWEDMTVQRPDGSPDLPAMLEKTAQCLARGEEKTLCEAAFSHEGLYCAVDLLRRQGDGWAIYEVKSSTQPAAIHAADLAYQKYVLEALGLKITGCFLVCLNGGYVRGEALERSELFRLVELGPQLAAEQARVPELLALARQILDGGSEPELDINEGCLASGGCPFWGHCAAHLPSPSVFDLYRLPTAKKFAYYRQGLVSYRDLRQVKLNDRQRRQLRFGLDDCGTYVDQAGLRSFLAGLRYPLYFLDFESMQPALPLYPGTRPYQQIPFQYSLHRVLAPGRPAEHLEFLAEGPGDPRRALALQLCRDIPAGACVLAYNKGFECSRLQELADCFEDLAPRLLDIRRQVQDLLSPFQSGYYYNRAMGGSFSIKSVLPAVFPEDPALNYRNLEGVHNGSEAMALYPKLADMAPEARQRARRQLLDYCRLDTLALVKLWQELCRAAEET